MVRIELQTYMRCAVSMRALKLLTFRLLLETKRNTFHAILTGR